MMDKEYYTLEELLQEVDGDTRRKFQKIIDDHKELFQEAPGSSANHQKWKGGYLDHVTEVMNIAKQLYKTLNELRELPFTLNDVFIVLFLHDVEKPWKLSSSSKLQEQDTLHIQGKSDMEFRKEVMDKYDISITEAQMNGLKYVEGEKEDYTPQKRVMKELAAFCHLCDTTSARIWFDNPKADNESWGFRNIQEEKEPSATEDQ